MLDGRAFIISPKSKQINSGKSWVWWRVLGTRADSIVNLAIKFTGEMVKAQISRDIWKVPFSLVFDEEQAKIAMEKLYKISSSLTQGLNEWANNGNEMDYTIEGIKLSELKLQYKLTYPAALLTMDWLIREPEKALASIKRGIR